MQGTTIARFVASLALLAALRHAPVFAEAPPAAGAPGAAPAVTRELPPAGAPNIVVVLLDDVGFGAASTFGGPVDTPALESLAQDGLRYNRFHTTAICSSTRAGGTSGRKRGFV